MNCRSCKAQNLTQVMHLHNVPKNVQSLASSPTPNTVNNVDFALYQCQDCSLVQAPMQLVTDYYDEYLMSQTFSPQLQEYLDGLVSDFLQIAPSVTRVLDLGCGDGAFMTPFAKRGISIEGIEPSERSRIAAQEKGLTVHSGYMTADTQLPSGLYDAFVSRQVLEHVDDIDGLLKGLRKNLTPGAWGIVEVPRLEKAIEDNRFYDFFPDHVNYFSLDTLRITMELHGFDVINLRPTMYDEYNVAIVRLRKPLDFSQIQDQRTKLKNQITELFRSCRGQGTAIWGAGAKGLSILCTLDNDLIDLLVDSDKNKIGQYVPGTSIKIQDPNMLMTYGIKHVIISAVAYQHRILEKLQTMNFQGHIWQIDANGLYKHQ